MAMKVYFASDHAGFDAKNRLVEYVRDQLKCEVEDCGALVNDPQDDYPDAAAAVGRAVAAGKAERGIVVCGSGILAVFTAYAHRMSRAYVAEYYALLATAGAGMCFFLQAHNLMTLFLGLEWFSVALYIICAIDMELETSLESGLKYLIIGSFGSAALLFGSALVYGATG